MAIARTSSFVHSPCLPRKHFVAGGSGTCLQLSQASRKLSRSKRVAACSADSDEAPRERAAGNDRRSAAARLLERAARGADSARDNASRVRDAYRAASEAARELESTEFGGVLGADFGEDTVLGRVSKTQDLPIPEGPVIAPLRASLARATLVAYVQERSGPEQADRVATGLQELHDALRLCVAGIEEAAEPLLGACGEADEGTNRSVGALLTLLSMAGFHCNAPPVLKPAALGAFPMKVSVDGRLDATIFGSKALKEHPLSRARMNESDIFPHALVAYRGTGVRRASGLLLGSKLNSVEAYYLGFLAAPLRFARSKFGSKPTGKPLNGSRRGDAPVDGSGDVSTEGGNSSTDTSGEDINSNGFTRANSRQGVVRRVFPSAKFSGWEAATGLFLPVFTQDPTTQFVCVAYRNFTPDSGAAREAKRRKIAGIARNVASRAIDPAKYQGSSSPSPSDLEGSHQPAGEFGETKLELWREVPWGHFSHVLPPRATKLKPRTRDLLRIDLLTLAGLTACLITIVRDPGTSPLLWAQILGTASVYGVRIALRLRQALSRNAGLLAREREGLFHADGEAALRAVGSLAVRQQFSTAAAVFISETSEEEVSVDELLQVATGGSAASRDVDVEGWRERLVRWGFLNLEGGGSKPELGGVRYQWD